MTAGDLKLQNNFKSIQSVNSEIASNNRQNIQKTNEYSQSAFADTLREKLNEKSNIEFSAHALKRLDSRNIELSDEEISRLNRGVDIAETKGSNEALVLIDSTAFVVSVRNHKVITALSGLDLKENVFTNIDSTVIM